MGGGCGSVVGSLGHRKRGQLLRAFAVALALLLAQSSSLLHAVDHQLHPSDGACQLCAAYEHGSHGLASTAGSIHLGSSLSYLSWLPPADFSLGFQGPFQARAPPPIASSW